MTEDHVYKTYVESSNIDGRRSLRSVVMRNS